MSFVRTSSRATTIILLMATLLLGACDGHNKNAEQALDNLKARIEKVESDVASLKSSHQVATTSYNSCILENMKGTTSDIAATSIKESCIRTVQIEAPDSVESIKDTIASATASYGTIYGSPGHNSYGLQIAIHCSGEFTITELIVIIQNKKTLKGSGYVVRTFPAPILTAFQATHPPEKGDEMMLPPGQHVFTLPLSELAKDQKEFFDTYNWYLSSPKGFFD